MERLLYNVCAVHKVSYITISHRPALLPFHDKLLTIGIGSDGAYSLERLGPDGEIVADTAPSCPSARERMLKIMPDTISKLLGRQQQLVSSTATPTTGSRADKTSVQDKSDSAWSTLGKIGELVKLAAGKGSLAARVASVGVAVALQAVISVKSVSVFSSMMESVFRQEPQMFTQACFSGAKWGVLAAAVEQFIV